MKKSHVNVRKVGKLSILHGALIKMKGFILDVPMNVSSVIKPSGISVLFRIIKGFT
jgi:hypothetical protein